MNYKIGINDHARIEYERKLEAKKNAFNELYTYCANWITIKDKKQFISNVCEYFKEQFQIDYAKTFNGKVPYLKRLEMFDVDLDKIKHLEKEFKSYNIALNLETMEAIKTPDFNMYLTNPKEIERYKLGERLIKTLDEFKTLGVPLDAYYLGLGFKNFIKYKPSAKGLTPTIK